jgi:hypothetical protein
LVPILNGWTGRTGAAFITCLGWLFGRGRKDGLLEDERKDETRV